MCPLFQVRNFCVVRLGFLLFLMMLICNYVPGGRLAGQVSLHDSLEFDLEKKIAAMDDDPKKLRFN